jgi:hypothetical protein
MITTIESAARTMQDPTNEPPLAHEPWAGSWPHPGRLHRGGWSIRALAFGRESVVSRIVIVWLQQNQQQETVEREDDETNDETPQQRHQHHDKWC